MDKYADMIYLDPPQSARRRMPISDRAAQFAPFAALTGFEDAVTETARQTEDAPSLDDYIEETINRTLFYIKNHPTLSKNASVTFFVPDEKKDGGSYQTLVGIKRIRETEQELLMYDGTVIPMPQIISIKNV